MKNICKCGGEMIEVKIHDEYYGYCPHCKRYEV